MADPIPGQTEYAYSRMYVVVNPNPALGPPTYRISIPEDLSGGGGTSGTTYDFDAEAPINVSQTPGTGTNPTKVVTSMDIAQLDSRGV